MTPKQIQKKYIKVVKFDKKWICNLQIDHQGFCIVDDRTKKEAVWYGEQLSIALARLIDNSK